MARAEPDGAVWGRPESIDSLGWRPGRLRRVAAAVLGAVSLAAGGVLGASAVVAAPVAAGAQVDPDAGYDALVQERTCASVGVILSADRRPAEGIPEAVVVALYRAEPTGTATMIVPRAHVLTSAPGPDGALNLSVLVRIGPPGDDRQVADVAGASAAGTLVATVLYDVDPVRVLDECREGAP